MEMSYEPVADGELAAVVTFLEMRSPPAGGAPRQARYKGHSHELPG